MNVNVNTSLDALTKAFLQYSIFENDLPVGIYAISPDGMLLLCNKRVSSILKLEGDLRGRITDYCLDQHVIEELIQKLQEAKEGNPWVEKHLLALKIEGREVFVHHHVRAIRDDETGETMGYLGCMVDITAEHRYQQIFEDLPVGVYQLDEDDLVTEANPTLADILGYENPTEIEGRSVKSFYADLSKADEFRERVKGEGGMAHHRVELRRKDGKLAVASVFARKVTSPDGKYIGREGAMIDVTEEERYKKVQEELPLGLYEVRIDDKGEDVFIDCNQQFATLLEFDDVKELKGRRVKDIYPTEAEYEKLKEAIRHGVEKGLPLQGLRVNVQGKRGKAIVLEVNARVRRDREGRVTGRVGAVRDVTEEVELNKRVAELTRDIGAVLHTLSSTLVNVRQSASVVIQTLGPDPLEAEKGIQPEQTVEYLSSPAKQFADSLAKLIPSPEAPERARALPEERWNVLEAQLDLLRNYEKLIHNPMVRLSTFRESALAVLSICGEIQKGTFPREPLRQVRMDARELLRICNLITLHQVDDLTLELDMPVRNLRAYVLSGHRKEESRTIWQVRELLSKTTGDLHEFARSRGIEFRIKHDDADCQVKIVAPDVHRALTDLLHNAVKYSWKRPGGTAWILIRTRQVQNSVHIEFENYGVPIPREEIDKGLIFQSGFRGRISSDRKRTGTGFGLFDAAQVAKDEGGDLTIRSHPASSGGREDDYKQPFLTTATLILPLNSR